ncbi:MAG: hypothetical protein ABI333_23820 [bacterium]
MKRATLLTITLLLTVPVAACGDDDGGPGPDATADASLIPDAEVGQDAEVTTECTLPPRDFWVYDLSVMPPTWLQVPSTCRAQGTHGIVYVADDIWDADLNQQDVDQVLTAFDESTPADTGSGIFTLTTATFGEPTDVDTNDRVILFYSELPGYGGYEFDGYIRREDVLGGQNSNGAEMLYLDGVRNDPGGEYMLGVVAHEFVHMIHLNHDQNEASWLEESLAEASMILSGYFGDLATWVANDFAPNPNQTLTTDGQTFNYGAGFLFGGYLVQRYGADFLTALVEEPADGVTGFEATLTAEGHSESFRELLGDWALANFLDAPTVGAGEFGYSAFTVPAMDAYTSAVPSQVIPRGLSPHAARYVVFELTTGTGATLEVALSSTSWADLELRYAVYADGDTSTAEPGSFAMTAQNDVLVISNVGGALDRVVISALEGGGLNFANVDVSAALQ